MWDQCTVNYAFDVYGTYGQRWYLGITSSGANVQFEIRHIPSHTLVIQTKDKLPSIDQSCINLFLGPFSAYRAWVLGSLFPLMLT